jgi:hypothetical protein
MGTRAGPLNSLAQEKENDSHICNSHFKKSKNKEVKLIFMTCAFYIIFLHTKSVEPSACFTYLSLHRCPTAACASGSHSKLCSVSLCSVLPPTWGSVTEHLWNSLVYKEIKWESCRDTQLILSHRMSFQIVNWEYWSMKLILQGQKCPNQDISDDRH